MNRRFTLIVVFFLTFCGFSFAEKYDRPLEDFPRESVHLFLLAGQSNMAGRGHLEEGKLETHPRVFALSKDGDWIPAVDPIHYDKSAAGVGLAKSFAITLAEQDPEIVIGLIPAACGGSPISTWTPGGYHDQTKSHPYDDAIDRAKRAMRDGELKGILWHQGESDTTPDRAPKYQDALKEVFERFRYDLSKPELPIIVGELGEFFAVKNDAKPVINGAITSLPDLLPGVAVVSAEGLVSIGDRTHFSSESLRIFGRRYAESYIRLIKRN